jgi:hypothetical protein
LPRPPFNVFLISARFFTIPVTNAQFNKHIAYGEHTLTILNITVFSFADDAESNHMTRLVGAFTMLVLLGVPWMFTAFAAIDSTDNANVQILEAVFNVR